MNILETSALTKTYGTMRAVDGLDMHVAEGDIYGFVGKNGAGKSTTMNMIAGLATPTAGEIKLFGTVHGAGASGRASSFSSDPSRIGVLIEDPGIIPNLSAYENLMTKALSLGVVRAREQCRELLELVGLEQAGPRKVKKFSMGMRQRLGVALALVGSPDLLLLDEPFNGMDPEATRELRGALVRLNQERGVTMIISSHVLDQLMRVANRFGVIAKGRMVREFTEDELHAACGSSIRVRTADPSRTLAILEERLAGADLRVDPDRSIVVSGTATRQATSRFGGASAEPASSGAPTVEQVSRILHDTDQVVLELAVLERDVEDYFVELMGGTDAGDARPSSAAGTPRPPATGAPQPPATGTHQPPTTSGGRHE
ncbi:ATP-binding cassette domain-containing protein [Collinsella sp. An2]|uniref:ATP-binding cassette domain-containing protein n=1 Tax=Collinsella sp. An2 TaxID=1965585 RepID=UPI000B39EED7|nr:ATP-binding cassette domain-containing protein [Collinsella sp. An2]OUP06646.1 ABC transporter [Collinsella sp. An2]